MPRENLVRGAWLGQWEFVDSWDPRVSLVLQELLVTRDPQEKMERLVPKETREMLASWVPGASRVNEG